MFNNKNISKKDIYRQNYSISYEIPAKYVLQSKLYKKDSQYVIQIEKWVMPSDNMKSLTLKLDGTLDNRCYSEIYSKYNNSIVMNLLKGSG